MPRFFFNIDDGLSQDVEGTELPSLEVAKREAVTLAGHLIADSSATFWERRAFNMAITDENGMVLFTLEFVGVEAPAIRARRNRPD